MFMILLLGCSDNAAIRMALDDCPVVAHKDEGVITCDIASVKDTLDMPLGMLLSDFKIVRLENSDEAMVSDEGFIWVSNNYIGTYSYSIGAYKLFDAKEKYLGIITSRGQGPNEFNSGMARDK
jgi:hypothetical protein